jgi:lipoprotein-anchoring transpeptidase ErfK/SrfK
MLRLSGAEFMSRPVLALCALALVLPQAANADPAEPIQLAMAERGQPGRANLGGGLIEFLVTGGNRAGTRSERPAAQDPDAAMGFRVDQGAPMRQRQARLSPAADPAPVKPALDPKFLPQVVDWSGSERPGTIVIDTSQRFLFLIEPGGKARRYGVGVGRDGFEWTGTKTITRKAEWPDWRPPAEMLKRRPDLPTFMEGGPDNPLGARALYLGSSLYRIHGSNEPETIGQAVSSGCFRMRNEDVTDLYARVRVGTVVKVVH